MTRTARPLVTVNEDWKLIDRLIAEWRPVALVVGLPLGRDNEEQAITQRARAFAGELRKHFSGPVHLCDERYSSRTALGDLREARASGAMKRRVRQGDKDSAAARVILEQWLGEQNDKK
jgi:putative Holliday junction resolvase